MTSGVGAGAGVKVGVGAVAGVTSGVRAGAEVTSGGSSRVQISFPGCDFQGTRTSTEERIFPGQL